MFAFFSNNFQSFCLFFLFPWTKHNKIYFSISVLLLRHHFICQISYIHALLHSLTLDCIKKKITAYLFGCAVVYIFLISAALILTAIPRDTQNEKRRERERDTGCYKKNMWECGWVWVFLVETNVFVLLYNWLFQLPHIYSVSFNLPLNEC